MLKVLVLFTLVAHVNAVGRTGRCSEGCDDEAMYHGTVLNCVEITQPDVDEEEHCQQLNSTKHYIEHVTSRSIHNTIVAHVPASGCKFLKRSTLNTRRLNNATAPSTLRSTGVANQLTLSTANNNTNITRLQRLFDGFQSLASLALFRNNIFLARLRTFPKSYDVSGLPSVIKTASRRVLVFLEPRWLNQRIDGSDASSVRVEVYAKLISNVSNELQLIFRCRIQTPFICLYLETSEITRVSDTLHRWNVAGFGTLFPLFKIQSAYPLTNECRMKRHRLFQLPMIATSTVVRPTKLRRGHRCRPYFFNASVDVSDAGQRIGINDSFRNTRLDMLKVRSEYRIESWLGNETSFRSQYAVVCSASLFIVNLSNCVGEFKDDKLYWLGFCRGNLIKSLSKEAFTANLSGTRNGEGDTWTVRLRRELMTTIVDFPADSCEHPLAETLYAVAAISAIVSLVALTGILVYKLRVKFYSRWKFHPFDRDECVGEDMDYDVFLCCSSDDDNPHGLRILGEMESKGYRVCYHERDFLPGQLITENMTHGIEHSKRTVCLLSESFLRSSYCMTEFDMAYHHNVAVKRKKRLIVLMMLDSPTDLYANDASNTATLRQYLRQYTYVDYTADDWLDKLLYALPLRGLLQQNEDPLVEIVQLP